MGYGTCWYEGVATHAQVNRAMPSCNAMNSESLPDNGFISDLSQVQMELLQALCMDDQRIYPWNPMSLESEAYFAQMEASGLNFQDWSESEVSTRSQQLFAHLDRLWESVSLVPVGVREALARQFANRVPVAVLEAIANKAQQVLSTPSSLADRLVECAQAAISELTVEDLQVLARPFAYAMRGSETDSVVEATLSKVRPVDWIELSELEQARMSLAIAHYALEQLHNS